MEAFALMGPPLRSIACVWPFSYFSGCPGFSVTKTINVGKPEISFKVNGQPFRMVKSAQVPRSI